MNNYLGLNLISFRGSYENKKSLLTRTTGSFDAIFHTRTSHLIVRGTMCATTRKWNWCLCLCTFSTFFWRCKYKWKNRISKKKSKKITFGGKYL